MWNKEKKDKKEKRVNRKILQSMKIIKEEKQKIRQEKKNMREKRYKNSRIGKFFIRLSNLFRDDKCSYSFTELFVTTMISLIVGAIACFSILVIFTGGRNYFKLSRELEKFFDVYETLVENYRDDINKDALVDAAIEGMVDSVGDKHTSYVDQDDTEEFNELVNGTYEGIGCTIQLQETGLIVIEVFKNSPAEKAGLKVDDKILKVDDIEVTKDIDVNEIANYIKTQGDGEVTMIILRDDEEKTIVLTRDTVETPVVNSKVFEVNGNKIGYLQITLFSSTASKQFKNELKSLEEKNISGLVIDVRNNSGGYLTTVKDIASQLLPKGKNIYQVEKSGEKEITRDNTDERRSYPIAVLINGSSASASEILAAAIKESYGGYVVGTTSYGKGTVQQVKKLSDGSMIKYTIENWLTPNGNWIDGKGVEPTDIVELDSGYYNYPVEEKDNQLQKALSLVSE